jgi:hypothetical protein
VQSTKSFVGFEDAYLGYAIMGLRKTPLLFIALQAAREKGFDTPI